MSNHYKRAMANGLRQLGSDALARLVQFIDDDVLIEAARQADQLDEPKRPTKRRAPKPSGASSSKGYRPRAPHAKAALEVLGAAASGMTTADMTAAVNRIVDEIDTNVMQLTLHRMKQKGIVTKTMVGGRNLWCLSDSPIVSESKAED